MGYKEQYEEAQKVGGVQGLTPEFMKFEKKGEVVLGKYITSSDVQGQIGEGTYKQYLFDTDEGLVKFAMGAATDREVEPQLIAGDVYRVVFEGKEKITGGRQVNKFKVEHIAGDSVSSPEKGDEAPF
jgi:hypothetical protein